MEFIEQKIIEMDGFYFSIENAIYHPCQNEIMNQDIHELNHFKTTLSSFFNYTNDMKIEIKRILTHFSSLNKEQKDLLQMNFIERMKKLDVCVKKNANFLFLIVAAYNNLFSNIDLSEVSYVSQLPYFTQANPHDITKLRITLKQFYRDWSKEGQFERDMCYKPIIDCLLKQFPDINTSQQKYKILLPGAGLGRLVYELALLGFDAQGNEFSYFMLLGSHFIINLSQKVEQFVIHPFANNFCNRLKENDAFQSILVPDVLPRENLKENSSMSFTAGEFIGVYRQNRYNNYWNGIITCFFLDTANNILDYIDTIYEILQAKGIWINFGPLEYHFANQFQETSIELSWEDIKIYIEKKGFELQFIEMKESTYNHSKLEQKQLIYNCIFFLAIKK